MTETYKFDWQKEPEGFAKWLIPSVIPRNFKQFDELSKATDKFRNVELTILVNGFEMDAQKFLEGVDVNMSHFALKEAARMLSEIGGFNELQERLDTIRTHMIEQVERTMREHGIELPEWDD